MPFRLPKDINRRFLAEAERRYTERYGALMDGRRQMLGAMARHYAAEKNPGLRGWLDRYGRCLGEHAQLCRLQCAYVGSRMKAVADIEQTLAERIKARRLEKRMLRLGERVAVRYEELYRSAVLFGGRTERDTVERRFFEELSETVGASRRLLETTAREMTENISPTAAAELLQELGCKLK